MTKLLFELNDVIHRKFKTFCINKGTTMKKELNKYIEILLKENDSDLNTEDLTKAITEKERKEKWELALKQYKKKKESKKEKKKYKQKQRRIQYEEAEKLYHQNKIVKLQEKREDLIRELVRKNPFLDPWGYEFDKEIIPEIEEFNSRYTLRGLIALPDQTLINIWYKFQQEEVNKLEGDF
ncbi:MAG: hypothetical protein ACFFCE_05760 [Promethearchaeota archaeon]